MFLHTQSSENAEKPNSPCTRVIYPVHRDLVYYARLMPYEIILRVRPLHGYINIELFEYYYYDYYYYYCNTKNRTAAVTRCPYDTITRTGFSSSAQSYRSRRFYTCTRLVRVALVIPAGIILMRTLHGKDFFFIFLLVFFCLFFVPDLQETRR